MSQAGSPTFKVCAQRCATCIYNANSPLDVQALEDEARDPYVGFKSYRACHHHPDNDVCCRGFWNRHKDAFMLGQLAQRLGMVEEIEGDPLADQLARDA